MPTKVRVGRSAFFLFIFFCFLRQKGFCVQNLRKTWLPKKKVNNCKKQCFSGDFYNINKTDLLGSGPFLGTVG